MSSVGTQKENKSDMIVKRQRVLLLYVKQEGARWNICASIFSILMKTFNNHSTLNDTPSQEPFKTPFQTKQMLLNQLNFL